MVQFMIDSVEGTQLGRGYVRSYECPWVSCYCDFVGRRDVLHGPVQHVVGSTRREGAAAEARNGHSVPCATGRAPELIGVVDWRIL